MKKKTTRQALEWMLSLDSLLQVAGKNDLLLSARTDRRFKSDFTRQCSYWLEEQIEAPNHGARSRTMDRDDCALFAQWLTSAVVLCVEHGIPFRNVKIRVDGGSVPGSYKYSASTTLVELDARHLRITRGAAKKRPHGNSSSLARIRVEKGSAAHSVLKSDPRYRAGYLTL